MTELDSFKHEFRRWLEAAFATGIPDDVVAFAFNIFELTSTEARYGVELIGASEFDPTDSDWACSEIWEPSAGRWVGIPRTFCDGGWELCLTRMTDLVSSILLEDSELSQYLGKVVGIGIGFVDGDLVLLKPSASV